MRCRYSKETQLIVTSLCLLLAWIAIPASSTAQEPRWSIAARIGHIWPGDLFRHQFTVHEQDSYVDFLESLHVVDMTTFGVSVEFGFAAGWTAGLHAERGSSHYEYLETQQRDGGLLSRTWSSRTASLTSFGMSLGRTLPLRERTSLHVSVDTRFQRVAPLDRKVQNGMCLQVAPSSGCPSNPWSGFVAAPAIPSWDQTYSIPGIGSSVRISRRLTRQLGVEAGAAYVIGRANTSVFWDDLRPEFDRYEAPRSYWMSTPRLFAGWFAYF